MKLLDKVLLVQIKYHLRYLNQGIPGIKVDKGAKDLAGFHNEKITEGLDGLRERLNEYFDLEQDLQMESCNKY